MPTRHEETRLRLSDTKTPRWLVLWHYANMRYQPNRATTLFDLESGDLTASHRLQDWDIDYQKELSLSKKGEYLELTRIYVTQKYREENFLVISII